MLKLIGDIGFIVASSGSLTFAVLYLASVRWWTDTLGRVVAGAVGVIAIIMLLSTIRLFGLPLPGLFWWRAIMFPALGVVMWVSVIAFVWSQFLAPRVRSHRARVLSKQQPPVEGE